MDVPLRRPREMVPVINIILYYLVLKNIFFWHLFIYVCE